MSEDGNVSPDEGGVPSNHDSSDGREGSPTSEALEPHAGKLCTNYWSNDYVR